MLSSINWRTLSSTKVTFCLDSRTMSRRSGITERGWSEEFNTRTGMNDFPSSLSKAENKNRQRGRSVKWVIREGERPNPSASTAACDDDQMDRGGSVLHVQVSGARPGIHRLPIV